MYSSKLSVKDIKYAKRMRMKFNSNVGKKKKISLYSVKSIKYMVVCDPKRNLKVHFTINRLNQCAIIQLNHFLLFHFAQFGIQYIDYSA